MRSITLIPILALCLLMLGGCTDDQLARSAKAVESAEVWQARAEQAHQIATRALEQAKVLAEQFDSDRAAELISRAEAALAVTAQGVEVSAAAVTAAKEAQQAAQAAHDAGGGTADKLIGGLIGALGAAALMFPKLRGALLLGQQLVRGIQAVRKGSGEEKWKTEVGPKLAESLDDAAKAQVDAILAKLPKVAA